MEILSGVGTFFSVLSDLIKPIPFHERSVSQGTSLEYQQQGNRSNLKINFFRLRRDHAAQAFNLFKIHNLFLLYDLLFFETASELLV